MRTGSENQVVIVDDDEGSRNSLKWLIESGGFPAMTFMSADHFLEVASDLDIGCLVLDVRMPGKSGVQLLEDLVDRAGSPPIVMISAFADVRTAVRAMRGGAVDFLEKPVNGEELLECVARCLSTQGAERRSSASTMLMKSRLEALTKRERQILDLIVAGRSNKQTAAELGISPRTVEVHRRNIMRKSGASSFAELVRLAAAQTT